MQIRVRNFRGVERADLEFDGIALLSGRNEAGKTSICLAVAAALTGQVIPVDDLKKSEAGALVRAGADGGTVEIVDGAGNLSRVAWPKAQRATEGKGIDASPVATGLTSLATVPARHRAALLAGFLDIAATRQDFDEAMADIGAGKDLADKIWEVIAADLEKGWDTAHERARDVGIKLKGQWEQITGERWGSDKGGKWLPAGWAEDLAGASRDGLEAAVTQARTGLEDAIAQSAVMAADRDALEREAADRDKLAAKATLAEQAKADALAAVVAARAALDALPMLDSHPGMPCPHCAKKIAIKVDRWGAGGAAEWHVDKAGDPPSKTAVKERVAARDAATTALRTAEEAERKAGNDLVEARLASSRAGSAALRLAELDSKRTGHSQGVPAVDAAREAVRLAESRLAAFAAKVAADQKHISIVQNQKVVAALDEAGIRRTVIARVVARFNAENLAPLCDAAKWPRVEVEPDMTIRVGGRLYALCAESQQWRARVILQLAMAAIDGSALAVIDRADVLDSRNRAALFEAVLAAKVPALIAMTANKPGLVPDLRAAGMGATYWLEGARCAEVGAEKVAA